MGAHFGFRVEEVAPVRVGAVTASSSRVRAFLLEGNPKGARDLLGRPYGLTGPVVRGDQRGRSIGFPTANLALEGELVPAHGVYATRVRWLANPDRPLHPAITNIGSRPTFRGQSVTVETHLFDFDEDLYGQRIEVELMAYIRGERRFDGPEDLVAQIKEDAAAARVALEGI
jgi:riboflavin kinase/FMN adenylyltransferase